MSYRDLNKKRPPVTPESMIETLQEALLYGTTVQKLQAAAVYDAIAEVIELNPEAAREQFQQIMENEQKAAGNID